MILTMFDNFTLKSLTAALTVPRAVCNRKCQSLSVIQPPPVVALLGSFPNENQIITRIGTK